MVDTARSQIGAPYRAGGCDPDSGYDCSGLVHWVYAEQGADLPRRSSDLLRSGRDVSGEPLLPADLLFYDMNGKGALHVGIYTGQGTFIHSPTTGGSVREESIDASWWRKGWIGARRIIADGPGAESSPPSAVAETPSPPKPERPAQKPASAVKPAAKPAAPAKLPPTTAKNAKPAPANAAANKNATTTSAPQAAKSPATAPQAQNPAPRDPAVLQALDELRATGAVTKK